MANILEYTLSLNDSMSSKLSKIGISSDAALSKFAKLEKQTTENSKLMNTMGASVGSLKQKLDLLRAEREWIPAKNLNDIQSYNREISSLEKKINKLQNTSTTWSRMKDSMFAIPGADLLMNPIVGITAGIIGATKSSIGFNTGMSNINTTAELNQKELKGLKRELLSIDGSLVKDWSTIPAAYEGILSQTSDVALSTDILKTSLKGSKAGFTDNTVVAGALAKSLSIIGKENANASEVMDTFFAAKNVGGAEFKDLAQYMPTLIASGDSLGIKYEEVAGMFAYMTAKGQTAERSTVLMENAFSAMSKMDIRKNLEGEGINIFDETGSVRSMASIFSDLKNKIGGMSNKDKSTFLEKMGITDKEARAAFVVMTSDIDKLSSSMNAVSNSAGATEKALALAANPGDKLNKLWSDAQKIGIKLGDALSAVLIPTLGAVGFVAGTAADGISWLVDGFEDGNPVVIGLTASVAALTIATKWNTIATKAQDFWLNALIIKEKIVAVVTRAKAIAMGIATASTWAWQVATMALNAAWAASPIGMVILGVTALGAAVYGVSKLFDQSTASEKLNNQVKTRALEKTIEQRSELEILFENLKRAKAGTDDYKKSLKDLESAYPGIIEKYNLQKGSLSDINAAHKELIANIDAVAQQEARKDILKENYQKILKSQMERQTGDYSTFEKIQTFTPGGEKLVKQQRIAEEYRLKGENYLLQKQIADSEIKESKKQSKKNTAITGEDSKVLDDVAKAFGENTEKEIKDRIKSLQDQKEGLTIGSKEYKSTDAEIERLQKKLNPSGSGRGSGRSSDAIATGGSKQTTINITLDNIVGVLTVTGKDFKEAKDKLQNEVTDAVVRALNMGTSTAG